MSVIAFDGNCRMQRDIVARYVRHEDVLDFAKLGWCIGDTFADVCHGQYSMLMLWMCDCPLVMPYPKFEGPWRKTTTTIS